MDTVVCKITKGCKGLTEGKAYKVTGYKVHNLDGWHDVDYRPSLATHYVLLDDNKEEVLLHRGWLVELQPSAKPNIYKSGGWWRVSKMLKPCSVNRPLWLRAHAYVAELNRDKDRPKGTPRHTIEAAFTCVGIENSDLQSHTEHVLRVKRTVAPNNT